MSAVLTAVKIIRLGPVNMHCIILVSLMIMNSSPATTLWSQSMACRRRFVTIQLKSTDLPVDTNEVRAKIR
jgi:hypothetical protein